VPNLRISNEIKSLDNLFNDIDDSNEHRLHKSQTSFKQQGKSRPESREMPHFYGSDEESEGCMEATYEEELEEEDYSKFTGMSEDIQDYHIKKQNILKRKRFIAWNIYNKLNSEYTIW